MSWVAAGSAAAGLLSSSGSGTQAAPASPSNIVFGSVNYKSAGAGDSGKSPAATYIPATSGLAGSASLTSSASVPIWVWIVGALGVVGVLVAILIPRRRRAA